MSDCDVEKMDSLLSQPWDGKETRGVFLDTKKNVDVQIELIHEAGYIVVDSSLGISRGTQRSQYIEEHGDDGRYSMSIPEAKTRLIKQ